MTANVGIVVARKKQVLSVPNAALRYRPPEEFTAKADADEASQPVAEKKKPGGKKQKSHVTVWILRNERPAAVRVKVGVTDGSYAEVKEGLEERNLVIVATQTSASSQGGTNPLDPKRGKKLLP
jgi:HlyD family secretion protein